jgi:hypothetical protein
MSYYIPKEDGNYPPVNSKFLSDELYDKILEMQNRELGAWSTQWIYLADCVSRGTISPSEAYDTLNLGYVPEHLTCRESLYKG